MASSVSDVRLADSEVKDDANEQKNRERPHCSTSLSWAVVVVSWIDAGSTRVVVVY